MSDRMVDPNLGDEQLGAGASPDATLEVLVIGAGFSGLCAGIKLRERGITSFRIVDKADGIGGTWWDNVYPGAACDVPSHFYCFSFEPNPNWTRLYSPQPEILQYMEHCADKYGLRPHIDLGREVAGLAFDDKHGLWRTTFADGAVLWSRFVIIGTGGLHRPMWPDIPGRDLFQGTAMHTALWDRDFDPTGKSILVIGSAASAIQVVPELAKTAKKVTLFQRTPNYIAPRKDVEYSDRQKRRFARNKLWARLYRWLIFMRLETWVYPIIMKERHRRKRAAEVKAHMRKEVADEALHAALEPDYELGCKRILISDDFYQALNLDNVELVTEAIDRITESGLTDKSGREHPADAIVFATGFDIESQFRALDVTGSNGVTLRDLWRDKVEAYRGVMVAGFPNYFMTTGPNTGVGTTSVIFMIEQTVGWIMQCIEKVKAGETVEATEAAQRGYNAEIQGLLGETVWASGCSSWYKRDDGRIETLVPYNARRFRKEMRQVHWEDLAVRSAGQSDAG